MKPYNFFSIIAVLILTAHSASAHHDVQVGQRGFGSFTYDNSFFEFRQTPVYKGSAVYNARRFGVERGFSPYYGRYENGNIGSHLHVRNKLDYQVLRNPDILRPIGSTNTQRYLRGFGRGQFRLFHTDGFTGRVRSFLN